MDCLSFPIGFMAWDGSATGEVAQQEKDMKNRILVCATLASLAAASGATAGRIDLESGGWVRLAEGVYQREDADGTVTRLGFDAGGALYDRQVLEKEIADLTARIAWNGADAGLEARLADLETALAGIPVVDPMERKPSAGIMSSQTGVLCGYWAYGFDSHLVVGKTGATVTARTGVGSDTLGTAPFVTSATQHASATLTPSAGGGSPIATIQSLPNLSTWMAPSTSDWVKNDAANNPVTASSCTADTLSYVSITAGSCSPSSGGYASMTKNYPTCVTAP